LSHFKRFLDQIKRRIKDVPVESAVKRAHIPIKRKVLLTLLTFATSRLRLDGLGRGRGADHLPLLPDPVYLYRGQGLCVADVAHVAEPPGGFLFVLEEQALLLFRCAVR